MPRSVSVQPAVSAVLAVAFLAATALPASAQLGIGPRVSWSRPNLLVEDSPSDRLIGAAIRASLSRSTAVEVSLDYRTEIHRISDVKTRTMPVQASLLLYPVRSAFSVYLLGGIGWYFTRVQPIGGETNETLSHTRRGYHAGLGGELMIGRHAGVYLDYRYSFIRYNASNPVADGAIPIPFTTSLQERLNLSHEGSAWTTGVTLYF